ncbi:unnamed protein product, partial [Pocillopora meandrina]
PSLDEIILGNEQLTMAGIVTNLGIIFDKEILFNDHINQLCRTFILGNLSLGLLATSTSRTKTYEDKAFSVCAPKLWNGLPNHVRNVGTLPLFKNNLKTYLF